MSLELAGDTNMVMAGHACSASCDVFIAGELHNRDELCGDLSLPAECRDAELVLSAWRLWGPAAFGRMDGVFAIIVRDMSDGRLWAARDPMGSHPLYFAQSGRGWLLSDSVTALLGHPDVSREVNRLKLAEMTFGRFGESQETFYKAVHRVPPAHYLCATPKSQKLEQYWFLPAVRPAEEYPFDEALQGFSRDFARAVTTRLEYGQTSIFLSGGVDSISIASQSADISRARGMAFPLALSLLFPHRDCDERLVQEAVARTLGLRQVSMSFDEAVGAGGIVLGALELSSRLSAPLLNNWRPAYVSLMKAAKRLGSSIILTGSGGDEWLGISPLYMADLIKRGQLFLAARILGRTLRSFDVPLHRALRFRLWTSGLRPLLVRGVRPIVTGIAPDVARAIWRRRQRIPAWVAPDTELRADLLVRIESDIERQFRSRFTRGRYAFYMRDAEASYIDPISSGEREEDFEVSKLVGQRLDHPYLDARLIRRLHEIPPELLSYAGFSKGLVRGPVAKRFPNLGLERQKKILATNFFADLMRRDLCPAWESAGGPKMLSKLGVVDRCLLDSQKSQLLSNGNARQIYGLWFLLNMESWVRGRESATSSGPIEKDCSNSSTTS
jgi:asparagine synthase (glutamine-hydrolysing)